MSASAALEGIRVVDLSRLAPGPYCSMLLSDFGADVILVEPPGGSTREKAASAPWELDQDEELFAYDGLRRNKRSIQLDLKDDGDRLTFRQLVRSTDVVLEGFRPGVAERLGASYEQCRDLNERIIYCSISGYGREGARASEPGHDINYIAEAGILSAIGSRDGRPAIPLNLLADFAGGGLMAAFAIAVALVHRERTGIGQRIDVAMVDGSLSLMTQIAGLTFALGGDLLPGRGPFNGGLPYYDTYRCSDRRWVAVGALEPWFFAELCRATGRPDLEVAWGDEGRFEEIRSHLEGWFGERTLSETMAAVGGGSCVTPVRTFDEAIDAAAQRGMVVEPDGVRQIGIAPKLSETPGAARRRGPRPDEDGAEIRAELETE